MENVPVKIVERYKPPPPVYQLPQTVVNRLQQYSENYYDEHPDYQYDFQLERDVLSKAQRWRQLRHQQQEERHQRQERRNLAFQRAIEAQQKEMLGAVEYPSAADLSSDSEDEETCGGKETQLKEVAAATATATTTETSISGSESHDDNNKQTAVTVEPKSINPYSFHTILQPTVLSGATTQATTTTLHKRNSSLNYADFEYNMNSTPFDIIELKTINDLDVLAQVLHNTQLKAQTVEGETEEAVPATIITQSDTKATDNYSADIPATQPVETQPQATPNCNNYAPLYSHAATPTSMSSPYTLPPLQQHLQAYQMGYNQHYYYQPQLYSNQNYLMTQQQPQPQPYVNGYGTPTHQPQPLASTLVSTTLAASDVDAALKSKSVPDILRELKTELQPEKRRARNNSHNSEQMHNPDSLQSLPRLNVFSELAVPAQKLAQSISGMGFPLERVAKVVSICGIDDKKIIEHLIPLSELVDLGFDETKISAALLKFNNNKDKALDYLIN
ncbi:ubiquitin-associated protein 1 [Scaptodrosophila lebanonensis]|uniref:Ubiquitin-associated protein 1 n=1 Tax=Drosophila lebanonensis TaxID=7225 RepID=A0A6J2TF18_DROLE|nr:ubiquitin-associated protein 1 [Scaptodrosophila lebanonensis]